MHADLHSIRVNRRSSAVLIPLYSGFAREEFRAGVLLCEVPAHLMYQARCLFHLDVIDPLRPVVGCVLVRAQSREEPNARYPTLDERPVIASAH